MSLSKNYEFSRLSFPLVGNPSLKRDCGDPRQAGTGSAAMTYIEACRGIVRSSRTMTTCEFLDKLLSPIPASWDMPFSSGFYGKHCSKV
jgi:hypothetical protein